MVFSEVCAKRGLPQYLLGWSYTTWTRRKLEGVVEYLMGDNRSDSKINLYSQLRVLSVRFNLGREDRMFILSGRLRGCQAPHNVTYAREQLAVKKKRRQHHRRQTVVSQQSDDTGERRPHEEGGTFLRGDLPGNAAPDSRSLVPPEGERDGQSRSVGTGISDIRRSEQQAEKQIPLNTIEPTAHTTVSIPGVPVAQDCLICLERLCSRNASRKVTAQCTHDIDTCQACVVRWVSEQARSKELDKITCPSCPALLQYQDLSEFAPQDIFFNWEARSIHQAMATDVNYVQCAFDGCNLGGICDSAMDSFIICPGCQRRTCIRCRAQYHDGLTCDEQRARAEKSRIHRENARRDEEQQTSQYFKKNSASIKICLNKRCAALLKKAGGCDHFTCGHCRHEFCWVCNAPYTKIRRHGNGSHSLHCSYHPTNLYRRITEAPRPSNNLPHPRLITSRPRPINNLPRQQRFTETSRPNNNLPQSQQVTTMDGPINDLSQHQRVPETVQPADSLPEQRRAFPGCAPS